MDFDKIIISLRKCEDDLVDNIKTNCDMLESVKGCISDLAFLSEKLSGINLNEPRRRVDGDDLVRLMMGALDGPEKLKLSAGNFFHLKYHEEESKFYIGRRIVSLSDTECRILHVLWAQMPTPVNREDIHAQIYEDESGPNPGVIDVFISKIRQKLRISSDGRDYIDSIRGGGWTLNEEFCASFGNDA